MTLPPVRPRERAVWVRERVPQWRLLRALLFRAKNIFDSMGLKIALHNGNRRRHPRETHVGIARKLTIRLIGETGVYREGMPVLLPQSRKTRGLLAYLALADRRHRREDLCELLWDTPGDPRAALRWSLSKLRSLLRIGTSTALLTERHTVGLDFTLLSVDVLEVRSTMSGRPDEVTDEALADLETRFSGGYLNGLEDLGNRSYQLWLEAERKSLPELHREIIGELMTRTTLSATTRLRLAGKRVCAGPPPRCFQHPVSGSEVADLRLERSAPGIRQSS